MKTIAVIGASGFVGSALVERLTEGRQSYRLIPFIHSSGNAMGLARRNLELRSIDLLDGRAVDDALTGVTHVVNCSRGGEELMFRGLRNLLAASKKHRIHRFVHLSSVAVYGDPPPANSTSETADAAPEPKSYAWIKLEQDRMVAAAAARGLPSIVLCPPNISGPGSYFLMTLVDALRSGTFALLEDGATACTLVDVTNLAHAIELALEGGPTDGRRIFITDDEETTWGALIAAVLPLAECEGRPPGITRQALLQHKANTRKQGISVMQGLKHLISSDVREAMRKDPFWAKAEMLLRSGIAKLGSSVEDKLKQAVEGPMRIARMDAPLSPLAQQQLRGVWHSCSLAKTVLHYRPVYSWAESMRGFSRWYRVQHGMNTPMWPLLRQLSAPR